MDHSALWLLTGSQFCSILLLVLNHSKQSRPNLQNQSSKYSNLRSNIKQTIWKKSNRNLSCEHFFWTIFNKMDHSALWLLTGGQFCSILLLVLAHSTQSRPTLQNQSPNEWRVSTAVVKDCCIIWILVPRFFCCIYFS